VLAAPDPRFGHYTRQVDYFRFVPYALRAAQLHENRSRLKRIFNDWERFSTEPVIRPELMRRVLSFPETWASI